jgi:hypothetical protein
MQSTVSWLLMRGSREADIICRKELIGASARKKIR